MISLDLAVPFCTWSSWLFGRWFYWPILCWSSGSSICGLSGSSSGVFMIPLDIRDWWVFESPVLCNWATNGRLSSWSFVNQSWCLWVTCSTLVKSIISSLLVLSHRRSLCSLCVSHSHQTSSASCSSPSNGCSSPPARMSGYSTCGIQVSQHCSSPVWFSMNICLGHLHIRAHWMLENAGNLLIGWGWCVASVCESDVPSCNWKLQALP